MTYRTELSPTLQEFCEPRDTRPDPDTPQLRVVATNSAPEPPAASTTRGKLSTAISALPWAFFAVLLWYATLMLASETWAIATMFPHWTIPLGAVAGVAIGSGVLVLRAIRCPAIDYLVTEARDGDPKPAHRAWLALVGTVGLRRAAALVNRPHASRWQVRDEDRA